MDALKDALDKSYKWMTDVAWSYIYSVGTGCPLCSHPLVCLFLVPSTLKQSGHTQESVCCLRSSLVRHNHFESCMLLLFFKAEPPHSQNRITHTHTHMLFLNLQTTVIKILVTLCLQKMCCVLEGWFWLKTKYCMSHKFHSEHKHFHLWKPLSSSTQTVEIDYDQIRSLNETTMNSWRNERALEGHFSKAIQM